MREEEGWMVRDRPKGKEGGNDWKGGKEGR